MSSQILVGDRVPVRAALGPRRSGSLVLILWLPLTFTLLGCLAFLVDVPLSRWLLDNDNGVPAFVHHWLNMSELFGHGFGAVLWLLCLFVLDPGRRCYLPRMITATLGAGIVANVLKLLIERTRPRKFDFDGTLIDSFGNWLPLNSGGSIHQSFASSHTATAAGLAIAFSWLYPRGRWLFVSFAVLAATQRLDSGFHFLSDVLVGAAVGTLWAGLCTGGWIAGRQFEKFEE